MSNFSYQDFQNAQQNRANGANSQGQTKIGFFKLADGAEALVRINCSNTSELQFATIHKPTFGKKWEGLSNAYAGISCLNEYGQYSNKCPFCQAAAAGHPVIGKATSQVYVQMLVAYINPDGSVSEPQAMVWERPSGFARELANKLKDYGDLKATILKVSRIGTGKETRYSLDYAVPARYPESLLPADFSAFNGFKIDRHSYWVKDAGEMATYLTSGSFPEAVKVEASTTTAETLVATPNYRAQAVNYAYSVQAPVASTLVSAVTPTPVAPAQNIQPQVGQTYDRAPWEEPISQTPVQQPTIQPAQPSAQVEQPAPRTSFNYNF